jgi:AraC-like DNA-binding protein
MQDLGYQTPAYFARIFKDRYGMTPTQYRKARQGP